jgi:two-component SAPR family response regulator
VWCASCAKRATELPQFIFVTAYEQHAVEAFRLEAMDYLLKPVDKARLAETIDRARRGARFRKGEKGAGANCRGQAPPQRRRATSCWSAPTTATSSWTPTT